MNIIKANQIAKERGFGKVFTRANGEICMNNKSGKVILTLNSDFSVKFQRWNMTAEVEALKEALNFCAKVVVKSENHSNRVDSGLGFYMENTRRNWDLCSKYGYDAIEMTN